MDDLQTEQGTDVATQHDSTMIEATPALLEAAYAAIQDGTLPPELGDPSITARAIQDRIKASNDFDQVFKPQSLTSWTEYVDEPVTVLGFHLNPSSFDEADSPAAYAVVEIVSEAGEPVTVGTGGGNVLMQLVKAWEQGWFPIRVVLRVKETRTPGRTTLWLEKVTAA